MQYERAALLDCVGGHMFLATLHRFACLNHPFNHVLRTFVILPLAGFAFLCAASWITSKREPNWAWILAGIYILGSILNLVLPSVFKSPLSLIVRGQITWRMILFGLLPPMYLWMALLIVTPLLVAMCLRQGA